jgi:hypothetical protein
VTETIGGPSGSGKPPEEDGWDEAEDEMSKDEDEEQFHE